MINYGKQSIDKLDIRAVTKVLKSNFITQGNEVENLKDCFQKIWNKTALPCLAVQLLYIY